MIRPWRKRIQNSEKIWPADRRVRVFKSCMISCKYNTLLMRYNIFIKLNYIRYFFERYILLKALLWRDILTWNRNKYARLKISKKKNNTSKLSYCLRTTCTTTLVKKTFWIIFVTNSNSLQLILTNWKTTYCLCQLFIKDQNISQFHSYA